MEIYHLLKEEVILLLEMLLLVLCKFSLIYDPSINLNPFTEEKRVLVLFGEVLRQPLPVPLLLMQHSLEHIHKQKNL